MVFARNCPNVPKPTIPIFKLLVEKEDGDEEDMMKRGKRGAW